jgi:hypothetical protein
MSASSQRNASASIQKIRRSGGSIVALYSPPAEGPAIGVAVPRSNPCHAPATRTFETTNPGSNSNVVGQSPSQGAKPPSP